MDLVIWGGGVRTRTVGGIWRPGGVVLRGGALGGPLHQLHAELTSFSLPCKGIYFLPCIQEVKPVGTESNAGRAGYSQAFFKGTFRQDWCGWIGLD
jgi:hypothetical protein